MSWIQAAAGKIRGKFHPLHYLRRSVVYKYCLQPLLDFPVQVDIGFRRPVHIRLLTHLSYLFLAREMEACEIRSFTSIASSLDPDSRSIYDVGGNIGLYTWSALDASPGLNVAVFEPDPRNFALLKDTARTWQAHNVHLFPCAASAEHGEASFSRDLLSSAAGTLEQGSQAFAQKHYNQQESFIQVRKFPLDDLLGTPGIPPPGLVKIDVEGHELDVLDGAKKVLHEYLPILFIESFSEKAQALQELLGGLGYKFFDADKASLVSPTTLNFLCLPEADLPAEVVQVLAGIGFPVSAP